MIFFIKGKESLCWKLSIIFPWINHFLCLNSFIFHLTGLVLFLFQLLLVCTCAYVRSLWPSLMDRNKTGILGTFWKCARIGERLSPWVALACMGMAFHTLFISWKVSLENNVFCIFICSEFVHWEHILKSWNKLQIKFQMNLTMDFFLMFLRYLWKFHIFNKEFVKFLLYSIKKYKLQCFISKEN